jgi:hypothetical protein
MLYSVGWKTAISSPTTVVAQQGIVTLVPNEQEFSRRCVQEDRAMKKAWEGRV